GISISTLTRLRCASDRGQHLLPYQATEWFDQHPIRAKAASGHGIRAQYSSLGPKLRGAVCPCTHCEVPCRLRCSRRSGLTASMGAYVLRKALAVLPSSRSLRSAGLHRRSPVTRRCGWHSSLSRRTRASSHPEACAAPFGWHHIIHCDATYLEKV